MFGGQLVNLLCNAVVSVCSSITLFMNNVYGLFCIACLSLVLPEEDPSGSKCCKMYDEDLCI